MGYRVRTSPKAGIMELKSSGISRKNFAKKLVELIVTKTER